MIAVVISRKLTLDLTNHGGSEYAQSLASEFKLWKEGGIYAGDTFGKDTFFMKPPAITRLGLRKVHLEDDKVTGRWTQQLEAGQTDPNLFTSDRVLVYGRLDDFRFQPYLLLTILDPGHSFMENPHLVRGLADAYELERKVFSCRMPTDPWVVAGM